jgi:hypothetical protein
MIVTREPTIEQYVPYRVSYRQVCDWPDGCKEYATHGFMRTDPGQAKVYRCLKHVPKWQSTYAKAFQYGIPEIHARYPGVLFESFTILHLSGATIEARDYDSVFTYRDFIYISKNPVEIPTSDLLKRFELEDWDWHVVVPGVLPGWSSEKHFKSGDPRLYTHCQACGESVEGKKVAWDYGQYHIGKCYDTLFADCLSCGVYRKDVQSNRSPYNHLWAHYAAQLCSECLDKRWKDRNFQAFDDEVRCKKFRDRYIP